jgi:hypothetical protein
MVAVLPVRHGALQGLQIRGPFSPKAPSSRVTVVKNAPAVGRIHEVGTQRLGEFEGIPQVGFGVAEAGFWTITRPAAWGRSFLCLRMSTETRTVLTPNLFSSAAMARESPVRSSVINTLRPLGRAMVASGKDGAGVTARTWRCANRPSREAGFENTDESFTGILSLAGLRCAGRFGRGRFAGPPRCAMIWPRVLSRPRSSGAMAGRPGIFSSRAERISTRLMGRCEVGLDVHLQAEHLYGVAGQRAHHPARRREPGDRRRWPAAVRLTVVPSVGVDSRMGVRTGKR